MHYSRWQRHGDPEVTLLPRGILKVCLIDGCGNPVKARGWCNKHYCRWQRHGDPLADLCQKGLHSLSGDNVIVNSVGARMCRVCYEERQRRWKAANPDKVKGYFRRWQKANPEYFRESVRKRYAAKRGATVFERVSLGELFERDGGRCHICKKKVAWEQKSMDHLVPLSQGGDHSWANVALAHISCNSRRGVGRTPTQLRLVG